MDLSYSGLQSSWAGIWPRRSLLVNSALHPSRVARSSTIIGWGNGTNVTAAGCATDPIWYVSSRSGVATCSNCVTYLLYFTYLLRAVRAVPRRCCPWWVARCWSTPRGTRRWHWAVRLPPRPAYMYILSFRGKPTPALPRKMSPRKHG